MKRIIALFLCLCLLLSCSACEQVLEKPFYEITASYDAEKHLLLASERVSYTNCGEKKDVVCFNVYANAYREDAKYPPIVRKKYCEAFENGESYGGFSIRSVLLNGEEATYKLSGKDFNFLEVALKEPLLTGESCEIVVDFAVELANVAHRLSYSRGYVNLGNFFPILAVEEEGAFIECPYYSVGDPFYSDVADFDVTMTAPSGFVVASSGVLQKSEAKGEQTVYRYDGENMRNFALTLSEKYVMAATSTLGVNVLAYADTKARADELLTAASAALKFYSSAFGSYPHDTLSVCSTDFAFGGMEYPALVFISSAVESGIALSEVVAHEVAHQWWYSAVGFNEAEDAFLDEGLAQYSTILFLDSQKELNVSREQKIAVARANFEAFSELTRRFDLSDDVRPMRELGEYPSEFEYTFYTYVYSVLALDSLYETAGEARFMRALKAFYRENRGKNADLEALASAFDGACGYSVSELFRAYAKGTAIQ